MLRFVSVAALVLFAVAGCDRSPTEPVTGPPTVAQSADFLNAPETSGPNVVRYTDGTVLTWDFPADVTPDGQAWTIMFGIDDVANMNYCGGPGTPYPISVQDIPRDDHFNRTQLRQRVPAFAGHSADVYAYDWCDRMDVPWIATGEASVTWSANVHESEGKSLSVANLSFNSRLTDLVTGQSYHAHFNQVWEWPPFAVRSQNLFIR